MIYIHTMHSSGVDKLVASEAATLKAGGQSICNADLLTWSAATRAVGSE
jgi:hypothetical protein